MNQAQALNLLQKISIMGKQGNKLFVAILWSVKATIPGKHGISILPVPHQT
jgi:hypothetical protein